MDKVYEIKPVQPEISLATSGDDIIEQDTPALELLPLEPLSDSDFDVI